jgi:predicted Zn-dependent protease
VFSLKGVLARIEDEHPAMEALKHVHGNAQTIQILSGVAALERGHVGYAAHTREWGLAEMPDNWALWAYAGEIELTTGNAEEAISNFRKAVELAPSAKWPNSKLADLINDYV